MKNRTAIALILAIATPLSLEAQEVIHPPIDHTPGIRKRAVPSDTGHYIGYWVGGGALSRKRGDGPSLEEGTWGWDYRGWLIPRRINLLWWHGRRYQGGIGSYRTDGPHLPDLPHSGGHGHEEGKGHSEGPSHPEGH